MEFARDSVRLLGFVEGTLVEVVGGACLRIQMFCLGIHHAFARTLVLVFE